MQAPVEKQPEQNDRYESGIESLKKTSMLLVKQKVEVVEAVTGFETENKYVVEDIAGKRIFFANEQSGCCNRNCCGNHRPFDMTISDLNGVESIHLERSLRCSSCFFPCCLQKVTVSSPPGNVIGFVKQCWSICCPKFEIQDENEKRILTIHGPNQFCCACYTCLTAEFEVRSKGEKIGRIKKQWSGLGKEVLSDADNFGVEFPNDLKLEVKACLLGAVFLIDFMYYEDSD